MSQCLFCRIVRGEITAARVHETDEVFSFLDISPVHEGHALVIPKAHHPDLFALPSSLHTAMLDACQVVGRAVMAATSAQGLNLGLNVYKAAGQLVEHVHFHLIPRFADDGLEHWKQGAYESDEEMAKMAEAIGRHIA
jgi:histidine triad (HIT) family protein